MLLLDRVVSSYRQGGNTGSTDIIFDCKDITSKELTRLLLFPLDTGFRQTAKLQLSRSRHQARPTSPIGLLSAAVLPKVARLLFPGLELAKSELQAQT